MEADDLRALANEHWRWFYRALVESLGGEWRRFGRADAFSTPNLPAAFANGLLVIEPTDPVDVVEATRWVTGPHVPFRVRIDTSLGADLLIAAADAGLVRDEWTMPGMVLTPVPAERPVLPSGVTTDLVSAENFAEFLDAVVATGMPRPVAEQAFDLSATEHGVDFYLGRLDGRPAATTVLVQTDDVAGIYSVATADGARRRGLGSAVTSAAVGRAHEMGSRAVVLQSSDMGLRVYEAIGFRTVVEYAIFMPTNSDADDPMRETI